MQDFNILCIFLFKETQKHSTFSKFMQGENIQHSLYFYSRKNECKKNYRGLYKTAKAFNILLVYTR